MKRSVFILGSFVVDLTAKASWLPVEGETIKGDYFKIGPGRKGANQAVAAARAGADVQLMTKIGQDLFSPVAIESFTQESLMSDLVLIDQNNPTGIALIMVSESGANQILVVPGASACVTEDDLLRAKKAITKSRIFLTQLEVNIDAVEKAIDVAHANQVEVILNPAPAQPIRDDLYKKINYITPNETETKLLTGYEVTDLDGCHLAANYFFDKGVQNVLITLGRLGVYVNDKEKFSMIPAMPVHVVDTTGAGDAFNGAFAASLDTGKDVFTAALFANVAAGLSVQSFGTAPAMPYRRDIDEALKEWNVRPKLQAFNS